MTQDEIDARRYRWLRERWGRITETYYGDTDQIARMGDEIEGEGWNVDPESLDAAIDAAIVGGPASCASRARNRALAERVIGGLPAPIGNPESWPPNYADGWNDCALIAFESTSAILGPVPRYTLTPKGLAVLEGK